MLTPRVTPANRPTESTTRDTFIATMTGATPAQINAELRCQSITMGGRK